MRLAFFVVSFSNGELVVRVKKNKLDLAQNKISEIKKAANILYGEIRVTLLAGEVEKASVSEAIESQMVDEDVKMADITEDIENLFGMPVDIIDN